uniref:DH domain-containing protein n=1 Tax=Pelodiscus sinensis TaxID=13735 RepID=K7FUK5_PELSI
APAGTNLQLSYLEQVVLELVESERMYVRDLRSIVERLLPPLPSQPKRMKSKYRKMGVPLALEKSVLVLSRKKLGFLPERDSDPVAVARCFVDRSQDFDIYTQYCNNYPNSVAALTECMRNKQQAKFFRERQEQIGHALPLGSYLLKPVQRILKYHLLLQHGHQCCLPPPCVGIAVLSSYTAWPLQGLPPPTAWALGPQEIQSLLLHWKGPDLTTFGELVLEGTFRVHRVRNERTFFLFDRTLLI